MSRLLRVLAPFALVACTGTGDLEAPDGASSNCGDAPPVIDELLVEEGDLVTGGSGDSYSSVRVTANISDPDFDLHWYMMRVWYDEDQAVSEGMEGEYLEIFGNAGSDVCNTQAAALRMQIGVTGNPAPETEYWWTVVVFDDQEHASEPMTQVFTTPADPL